MGPKYGKFLNGIRTYLAEVHGNAAMDELKEKGSLTFDVNGVSVVLSEEDLLIDMAQTEGYVSDGDNEITVVLDTKLTPELIEEGYIREIISKIQTMRKEAGFEVTDIYRTNVCPLARVMRRELRKRGIQSLKVVYSTEEAQTPKVQLRPEGSGKVTPGSMAFVPGAAGLLLASQVVKDLLERKQAAQPSGSPPKAGSLPQRGPPPAG